MAIKRRVVVGVFDEPAMAENAVNALQNAGFVLQQIIIASHYSETEQHAGGSTAGEHHKSLKTSFVDGLKQLFTGKDVSETDATPTDVEGDLTGMGLSDEEARYYEDQYKAGRSVIGVRAEDREDDALSILRANGGHDFARRPGGMQRETTTTTGDYGRNVGVNQPGTMQPPVTGTTGMPGMQPPVTGTTGTPGMQPRTPVTGTRATQEQNVAGGSWGTAGSASPSDIDRTGTANPMRSRDINESQPVTGMGTERERMRMEQEGSPYRQEGMEPEFRNPQEGETFTDKPSNEPGRRETRGSRMPTEQEAQRARKRLENEYERRIRENPDRDLGSERDIETDL